MFDVLLCVMSCFIVIYWLACVCVTFGLRLVCMFLRLVYVWLTLV